MLLKINGPVLGRRPGDVIQVDDVTGHKLLFDYDAYVEHVSLLVSPLQELQEQAEPAEPAEPEEPTEPADSQEQAEPEEQVDTDDEQRTDRPRRSR